MRTWISGLRDVFGDRAVIQKKKLSQLASWLDSKGT
jgi:hypothetical protein